MEAATVTNDVPATAETGLTKFFVLTASDDLQTYTLVKVVEARDRDQAARRVFGKNPPLHVAVSEAAFKVRRPRRVAVVRGLEDVAIPDPTAIPMPLIDVLAADDVQHLGAQADTGS